MTNDYEYWIIYSIALKNLWTNDKILSMGSATFLYETILIAHYIWTKRNILNIYINLIVYFFTVDFPVF